MTIVSTASAIGVMTQITLPGSAIGFIDSLADDVGTAVGTVVTGLKDSYDGGWFDIINDPTLVPVASEGVLGAIGYGYRIILNEVDVSDSVVADIQILQDMDRLRSAEFTLFGKEFSFVVTTSTWTAVPVTIFFSQGLPGLVTEELKFTGFVSKGQAAGRLLWRVYCLDRGMISSKTVACLELDPESGFRRDTIVEDLLTTAGFAGADYPQMEVYDKIHNFTSEVWGQTLDFIEPEGLHQRVLLDGTVEGYTIEFDLEQPTQHRWDVEELLEYPVITPPDTTESVWVVKGEETVVVTGGEGATVELTVTEIFGIFNKETTDRHDGSGVITPRSFPGDHSDFTIFQLIKRLEVEVHRQGTRIISKIEKESEWKNPLAGRYLARFDEGGSGPQGSDFLECFVTQGGEFVIWSAFKFVKTLERTEIFKYDQFGTDIGSTINERRYHLRRKGFKIGGSVIGGVRIGNDNMSYVHQGFNQIEIYGLANTYNIDRTYNGDGAHVKDEQDTLGYYSIRRDVGVSGYILFDGSAQKDADQIFQLVETVVKNFVVDVSGRKLGEVETTSGFFVRESDIGPFDYGLFTAEAPEEVFLTLGTTSKSFDALNSTAFRTVEYDEGGARDEQTFPGSPPVPRYLSSSYTRYISNPIEAVFDDPVIEEWFGRKTKVVQIKHALDLAELQSIATRRRSRILSYLVRITRLETLGVEGDSLTIVDTNQGLFHAGVIVSIRHSRTYDSSITEYYLECPLFRTGLLF